MASDETAADSTTDLTGANFGELVSQAQLSAGSVRVVSRFPYPQGPVLVETADVTVGGASTDLTARIVTKIGKGGRYGDAETRVIGSTVYQIDHLSAAYMTGEPPWRRSELADTDDPAVRDVTGLLRVTDPAQVSQLYDEVLRLDDLGESTVDGVAAHCYRVTVPPGAIWTDPTDDVDPELEAIIEENMPDSVPIKACVDGRMLPVTVQMADSRTLHFSRWGRPFETSAPPADQVDLG